MNAAVNVVAGLLISAMAPALLFGLSGSSPRLVPLAFVVALVHVVVLGIPLLAILWQKGWVNGPSAVLSGFVIGAAGVAIFAWPFGNDGTTTSAGTITTMIDGVPTLAGWLQYLLTVAVFGAFGALGGLVFWLWLRMTDALPSAATYGLGWATVKPRGGYLPSLAALLLAVTTLSVPAITKDRSCHNVLRDGRSSISSQLNIDLDIQDEDWDKLRETFASLASQNRLSFRDDSEVRPDVVRTLYLSVCDDGTTISTSEQRWASQGYRNVLEGRGVGIFVYQTRESADWRTLARSLIDELEQRWPDQVRFRGGDGRLIPEPSDLAAVDPDDGDLANAD